jgi:hypothetical protein
LFCALLLPGQFASAATLYIDPGLSTLARGDGEIVSVRLDTDEASEECVNAVEGVVQLVGPARAVDVSLGGSIFSIWIETPTISNNGQTVTFAGGIPNGYCGRVDGDPRLTNNLFDIILRTDAIAPSDQKTVEAVVNFTEQTHAYLNDGFGTKATLTVQPKFITVLPNLSNGLLDPWKDEVALDTIKPQVFSVELTKDSKTFSGKYYITFNTTDKQTGIDHYEIIEEPLSQFGSFLWGRATAPWVEDRSPYVLKDQTLNSVIRVKAVDKAGNEHITTLLPDKELRSISVVQIALFVLLGISILVFAFGSFGFIKRRRHIQKIAAFEQEFTEEVVETDEQNNEDNVTNKRHDNNL